MSPPRFFCPQVLAAGQETLLPDAAARHAGVALRLRDGDPVVLFNGNGLEYRGELHFQGKRVTARIGSALPVDRESPLDITLAQGISSGERMDYTLQKAVELGVTRIQPVTMRRTIVRLEGDKREKRRQHWQGVVTAACEQCGRNRVPEVDPIQDFTGWLRGATARAASLLLLDPEDGIRVRDLPPPAGPLLLIAGPEGGFDPAERAAVLATGARPLRLGPRVLRTETAAVAALAALQGIWGDA